MNALMLRSAACVVMGCCVACAVPEPKPVPTPPAPPAFGLQVMKPAAAGFTGLTLGIGDEPGASLNFHLFQGETELGSNEAQPPVNSSYVLTYYLDAGDYRATLDFSRGGEVIATTTADFHVYPTLALTQQLPGPCSPLVALNDDASQFECGGRVMTPDGGDVEGHEWGSDTRVVRIPGGAVRWVRAGGSLRVETARGVSNTVEFPDSVKWVATSQVAISGATVARLWGNTLSLFTLEEHGLLAPFVAASKAGQYAVLLGVRDFWSGPPFTVCQVTVDQPAWRYDPCVEVPGSFVRQEARDGRVLMQNGRELVWLDLFDPEHPTVARTLRADETFLTGGQLAGSGSGAYVTLTRAETLDLVALSTPDGRLPADAVAGATSDVAWLGLGASGEMYWAPLP